ncbi:uncharacterized protein LOC17893427 [Capsella rubella]|uniref:uncharacterized protein LOC17893427 n=1 Tax=Capsella rubella TaxID=81985 RepID=UPI000CD52FBE|nr:uncharacterized protein LOC17893427 [Capsella rubella]
MDKERFPDLPPRLFSASKLPDGARLNIHSKPEYLGVLVEVLDGTEAWTKIRQSQFGNLFDLPVARCSNSAKLIHGMLARQLVTKKKHELWFVYGGFPLCFSLREFQIITGLRCAPLPSDAEVSNHQDPTYLSVWNRLFGYKKLINVSEVLDMLREDALAQPEDRLCDWKRISLALIVIVEGVIVCSNSRPGRVSGDIVEMLHDTAFFLEYPWGRRSFNETLSRFGPVFGKDDPFEELKRRLSQQTSCCYGFPLALQLQVLRCIPALCSKLKDSSNYRNFMERSSESLSSTVILRESDVNDVEKQPYLTVKHTLLHSADINESELRWDDEESDPRVDTILRLISENHKFTPSQWPYGERRTMERPRDQGNEIPTSANDILSDVEDITPGNPPTKKVKVEKNAFVRRPFTRSAGRVNVAENSGGVMIAAFRVIVCVK